MRIIPIENKITVPKYLNMNCFRKISDLIMLSNYFISLFSY